MPTEIDTNDEMTDQQITEKSLSFAEKILKKHGWKSGEGLGKHSQGISKPIKPSLKFDKAGVGHDPAKEFTNSWWDDAYKQAADNVIIDNDQDGTVKINWKKKSKEQKRHKHSIVNSQYTAFVQSATLESGKLISNQGSTKGEDEINDKQYKKAVELTDEELFKACGGLTAHKGARHGHKMSAKQKRIELQEKELLMQMKKTYNLDPVEATQNIARLKTENSTNLYEMDTNSKRKHDNSPCEKRKTKLKPIHDPATSTNSLQYTGNLKESSLVEENQNSDKQDPNSKRKKKKKRRKSEESLGCDENLIKHTPHKKKKEKHK